jgi:hypothetical protein
MGEVSASHVSHWTSLSALVLVSPSCLNVAAAGLPYPTFHVCPQNPSVSWLKVEHLLPICSVIGEKLLLCQTRKSLLSHHLNHNFSGNVNPSFEEVLLCPDVFFRYFHTTLGKPKRAIFYIIVSNHTLFFSNNIPLLNHCVVSISWMSTS